MSCRTSALALLLTSTAASAAPLDVRIAGSDAPLPGAEVIVASDGGAIERLTTDAYGRVDTFATDPQNAAGAVLVRKAGYRPVVAEMPLVEVTPLAPVGTPLDGLTASLQWSTGAPDLDAHFYASTGYVWHEQKVSHGARLDLDARAGGSGILPLAALPPSMAVAGAETVTLHEWTPGVAYAYAVHVSGIEHAFGASDAQVVVRAGGRELARYRVDDAPVDTNLWVVFAITPDGELVTENRFLATAPDEIAPRLERVVAQYPAHPVASKVHPRAQQLNALGEAALGAGNVGVAIAAFEQAVALQPDAAWTLANLGAAYARAGEIVLAMRANRLAIVHAVATGKPAAQARALYNQGQLLEQAGQLDAARASYASASALVPDDNRYVDALARFDEPGC